MDELIKKALSATQEADDIEFKSAIDVNSKKDWVDIIKDIVALANSGGGVIVFGVDDHGFPSNFDTTEILKYDPR